MDPILASDSLPTEHANGTTRRRCNSLHCGPGRRTAVYRLYNRDQRLLYVGIAHDTKKRWREHARDKDWWNQVHWRTAVWHGTRLGAAIEEYCAFRFENPIYNKNREYDYRLGWEPGASPGCHEPRPWRLNLLSSAMRYPEGATSWDDAAPHYAVVKCANQTGVEKGRVRVWFPQIPELGYWTCASAPGPNARTELHHNAASILTEDYGLDPGSFTLSLHDADKCAEPALGQWAGDEEQAEATAPVPNRPWWKKVDALWRSPKPAIFIVEWWGNATVGMFAAIALDSYVAMSHHYSPGGVMLMGMGGGLVVRAANKLMNWWDGRP